MGDYPGRCDALALRLHGRINPRDATLKRGFSVPHLATTFKFHKPLKGTWLHK